MATYTPVPQFNQTKPKAELGYAFVATNLLVTTLAVVVTSLPPGKQLSTSAPPVTKTIACEQQQNTLARGINPNPKPLQLSTSAPITKTQVFVTNVQRNESTLPINPNPKVLQLSVSSSRLGEKRPVVADQFLNYSTLGIPTAGSLALPLLALDDFGGQYKPKYQVVADQYINTLLLGYDTLWPSWNDVDPAPQIKRQNVADQFVNRLVLQSVAPAAPTVPVQTTWPQQKYNVTVDQIQHPLTLGINPNPQSQQSSTGIAQRKTPVVADQFLNYDTLGIPAPSGLSLPLLALDDCGGQYKPKYEVVAEQPPRPLTLGINPNPQIKQSSDSTPALRKTPVVADQFTNYMTLGVNPNPLVVQLSESAPRVKYQVQLDQPLQTPLTLGINPNPKPLQVSTSATPPISPVVVLTTPNLSVTTLKPADIPIPLPLGLPFDEFQYQTKFSIQIDNYPNTIVGGIPDAPPPATDQFASGGGGGGGRIEYRGKRGKDAAWLLNKALDDVVAEVMYKDLIQTEDADKAAKLVKPYADDRKAAIPTKVDWKALEDDAARVGQLLTLWSAHQLRNQQELDDEDWFMGGD